MEQERVNQCFVFLGTVFVFVFVLTVITAHGQVLVGDDSSGSGGVGAPSFSSPFENMESAEGEPEPVIVEAGFSELASAFSDIVSGFWGGSGETSQEKAFSSEWDSVTAGGTAYQAAFVLNKAVGDGVSPLAVDAFNNLTAVPLTYESPGEPVSVQQVIDYLGQKGITYEAKDFGDVGTTTPLEVVPGSILITGEKGNPGTWDYGYLSDTSQGWNVIGGSHEGLWQTINLPKSWTGIALIPQNGKFNKWTPGKDEGTF
jgi:hypothetical protein